MSDPRRRPRPFRPVSRGTAQAIVALFLLAFLLSGASFWLSVRTVQGQIRSRASVVQLCQSSNESRAQQVTLWAHLVQMSAPPPHETAAARAARQKLARDFLTYIRHVFAQRDCAASLNRRTPVRGSRRHNSNNRTSGPARGPVTRGGGMSETDGASPTPGGGWVPVPDPTILTATSVSQAKDDLRRELASQKEILEARIARNELTIREAVAQRAVDIAEAVGGLQALLTQRIAGLETILKILDNALNRGPEQADALRERLQTDISVAVENLQHLHEERFNAIQQQFSERDTRSDQDKKSSKEALDAALLAQKESVSQQNDANTTAATKTETNFTKQIDLVGTQITALDKSLSDRISELKERIDRGEGTTSGEQYRRTEQRLDVGQVVAAVAVIVAILSVVLYALKR